MPRIRIDIGIPFGSGLISEDYTVYSQWFSFDGKPYSRPVKYTYVMGNFLGSSRASKEKESSSIEGRVELKPIDWLKVPPDSIREGLMKGDLYSIERGVEGTLPVTPSKQKGPPTLTVRQLRARLRRQLREMGPLRAKRIARASVEEGRHPRRSLTRWGLFSPAEKEHIRKLVDSEGEPIVREEDHAETPRY